MRRSCGNMSALFCRVVCLHRDGPWRRTQDADRIERLGDVIPTTCQLPPRRCRELVEDLFADDAARRARRGSAISDRASFLGQPSTISRFVSRNELAALAFGRHFLRSRFGHYSCEPCEVSRRFAGRATALFGDKFDRSHRSQFAVHATKDPLMSIARARLLTISMLLASR